MRNCGCVTIGPCCFAASGAPAQRLWIGYRVGRRNVDTFIVGETGPACPSTVSGLRTCVKGRRLASQKRKPRLHTHCSPGPSGGLPRMLPRTRSSNASNGLRSEFRAAEDMSLKTVCSNSPQRVRWHFGQKKLDRFINGSRRSNVPHRPHGSPARPYAFSDRSKYPLAPLTLT